MTAIIIRNATIWDGTGAETRSLDVLVSGNRIDTIAASIEAPAADVIDGTGMTLMPGMVEGHAHPSFTNVDFPWELGLIPPEEHTLATARNAKLLLDHGFTSIFEAASAKPRLGVVVRNAINAGELEGPRMLAASPEITVTAGLGDERKRHIYQESFGLIIDSPDEMRRTVRTCIRDGVDTIKVNLSGDEFVSHARGEMNPMTEAESAVAVEVAHTFGKRVVCHARAPESVKRAVRQGYDLIYHCDFADEEALDALESVKDRIFVGPAFGLVHNSVHEGEHAGMSREMVEAMGLPRKFDHCVQTYHEMRRRGIRVVIGGDYGFSVTPMGTNARDIHHFVEYFGYEPHEALQCATQIGGQLMGLGDELGLVKEGFLADLLLLRGNPLEDVSILQHRDRLAMIMKDGRIHKDPRTGAAARFPIAAE